MKLEVLYHYSKLFCYVFLSVSMWLMYCSSFLWGCFKLIVYSHTSGGEGVSLHHSFTICTYVLALLLSSILILYSVFSMFLVFQVPTVWETIDMWKKNHNPFRIACGWFLANSCFLCFGLL